MTRNDLCELVHQYAIDYSKYAVELVLADLGSFVQPKPPLNPCGLIHAAFKQQICANCKYFKETRYCSVIDDHYTEHYCGKFMPQADFGCNRFESCK